ncbi:MAG: toxin [Devosia sp.]|nr:toxin [Devosia sp.]
MALQVPASITGSDSVVDLKTTDDLLVTKDVVISATTFNAVTGSGSGHELRIFGTIAAENSGIYLGTDITVGNEVWIAASGQVHSFYEGWAALFLHGGVAVRNEGLIAGETGIYLGSYTAGISQSIMNSGSIEGGSLGGVVRFGSTSTITLTNSGTISGDTHAYYGSNGNSVAIDNVTNTGKMVGIVDLGAGKDFIANSGTISGNVLLGDGNDIYRGTGSGYALSVWGDAGNDTISGGTRSDFFVGGVGADLLTGGLGNDRFYFKTIADSTSASSGRDRITDFTHGSDKIELNAIDANGGVAGNGVFSFIAGEGVLFVSGVRGQLRWDQVDAAGTANDHTYIYGDIDGEGTADFALDLLGLKTLTATDFVL